MKRFKIIVPGILLLLLSAPNLTAQVRWHTINEASTATIGQKLYFIDFYTDWCGYCKKMDRDTFTDTTVAKILNRYFYPVKFNAESTQTFNWKGHQYKPTNQGRSPIHEFALTLLGSRMGFPTYAILNSNGEIIQNIPGYYTPHDFIIILWYIASGDYLRYNFESYSASFDKNIRPTLNDKLK